jgi:UDP-N-acetylmuramate--alanine ligase
VRNATDYAHLARLPGANVDEGPIEHAFQVTFDGETLGWAMLRVPGRHNVLNALAAIGSGLALGAPFPKLVKGLLNFRGADRRFERLGEARGVTIIDDYAHHPTEINATLAAARAAFPGRRVIVAFQPHLYSRTRDFAREFAGALSAGDAVYLTEIYPSREQQIPGVTADLVANAFGAEKAKIAWRGERAELAEALAAGVREGDVVITMGAGDITKAGRELLARLRKAA